MKIIVFKIIYALSKLGLSGCIIWVIAEFMAYIVRDKPFNWNCIYITILAFVVFFVSGCLHYYFLFEKKVNEKPAGKFLQRVKAMEQRKNGN